MKKENNGKPQPSQKFLEQKQLIQMQEKLEKLKHKFKMMELETYRRNDTRRHEQDLETIRIKSAEIKRTQGVRSWK